MIPVTYLWEVLVVSPALFPDQQQALGWALHMAFGLLVVVNIAGNFGGLWLVDTSTTHIVIPSSQLGSERWHYCAACEAVSPPRAWHCSVPCLALAWRALLHLPQLTLCLDRVRECVPV